MVAPAVAIDANTASKVGILVGVEIERLRVNATLRIDSVKNTSSLILLHRAKPMWYSRSRGKTALMAWSRSGSRE